MLTLSRALATRGLAPRSTTLMASSGCGFFFSASTSSGIPTAAHIARTKRWRVDLIRRARDRSASEQFPVSLLGEFAKTNVPQLTEAELPEFERLLMLDQPLLRQLTERPGTQRPVYIGENYTLDRFLNMVRHRIGKQEYR